MARHIANLILGGAIAERFIVGVAVLTITVGSGSCRRQTEPDTERTRDTLCDGSTTKPKGPFMTNHRVKLDDERDTLRFPNELMAFLAIKPGSIIVDIGSGDGYTSMYLARETGSTGIVYAHNTPEWRSLLVPYQKDRLKNGALSGIQWTERDFEDPIGPELRGVDLVINVLTYHDLLYMSVNRDVMNKNIYNALRPGGRYVVVDHAARDLDADKVGHSLHRISEEFVTVELRRAGFVLERTSDVMRFAGDDRTTLAWTSPQPRTDRFILSFTKPMM